MNEPSKNLVPIADQELVQVFDTADETEAQVVHGLLVSSDIECMLATLDAPQDVLPGVGGTVIRVRADQALEAQQIITGYRNTSAQDLEAAEAETEGGGPEGAA